LDYQEIVERRRALVIEPYKSLAEVGFDGPWVTPYQIAFEVRRGPRKRSERISQAAIRRSLMTMECPLLKDGGHYPSITKIRF
jgi:hypothetical protein